MASGVDILSDTVTARLNKLIENCSATSARGYMNRVAYPQYQKAQIERWDSENESETGRWAALSPTYKAQKLTRFAAYPYGGTRMGIATGKLIQSVVGTDTTYHRKIVDDKEGEVSLTVMTTLDYAPYFAEFRPIMEFSDYTRAEILDGLRRYLMSK